MKYLKLTKEQAVKEHRKMWNWIADQLENGNTFTVSKLKEKYCDENNFNIMHDCFCCEYDKQQKLILYCRSCPVLWGSENIRHGYYCESGVEDKMTEKQFGEESGLWLIAQNLSLENKYEEAAIIARQIANLPERKD